MKNTQEQKKAVWSLENVTQWLIANNWSSLVDTFTDYNIQHDRFLNLDMENLEELLFHEKFASIDKQELLSAIQQLKAEQKPQRPRIVIPPRSSVQLTSLSRSKPSYHSTRSYTSSHYTATPTHRLDITQFIPKRTSSNESNVSRILESFQPTQSMMVSTSSPLLSAKSPRFNATNPAILSKLFGKRLPVPNQERRIQVTLDADTFIRLWVDSAASASEIKRAILNKLSVEAEPNYFLFFHENGPEANTPLNDEELIYVCQTSTNSETNRVLVVPVEGYQLICQQFYHHKNTSQTRFVLIQTSPTPSPISSSSVTGIQLTDPETPQEELSSDNLNDMMLLKTAPNDLWVSTSSHLEYRRPSASSSSSSLWHISSSLYPPPSSVPLERTFEGVSLYDPPTPIHDPSTEDYSIQRESPFVESPPSPLGSDRRSASQSSQEDPEEDVLGERPPIEKLYQDMDKYLPQHDLDKEILSDALVSSTSSPPSPTPTNTTPPVLQADKQEPLSSILVQPSKAIAPAVSRRLLGHRPSVRFAANEAHRRWKQTVKNDPVVSRSPSLMRRKSTKMWDRPIERVKPGEESRIELTPVNPTKMQWMRGDLIGHGSFSRVYHGLNLSTLEWMAVKQVDAVMTKADQRNQDLKAASDALYREIRLLKDLDHENIVQYIAYDFNAEEGHIYIFLEYVPGGSISSLLHKYQCLDEPLTSFFTRQILQGLQYLHERDILHRDIKGGNVLIANDGVCKITDFGLSKNQQDSDSNHSQMKGTLYWMAPEVLKNEYSPKVDIWSLGCTVLEMITGEHPWMELTTLAALYQIGLHNAPTIPDYLSESAQDFLRQCFKIDPKDRPTASELLQHPFVQPDASFDFKTSLSQQKPKSN
ncbi:kinase-like domain-containing protein [Blakeslea trispora]|nr:kinase-like domain-containing protein [Blakeslea trispora]